MHLDTPAGVDRVFPGTHLQYTLTPQNVNNTMRLNQYIS